MDSNLIEGFVRSEPIDYITFSYTEGAEFFWVSFVFPIVFAIAGVILALLFEYSKRDCIAIFITNIITKTLYPIICTLVYLHFDHSIIITLELIIIPLIIWIIWDWIIYAIVLNNNKNPKILLVIISIFIGCCLDVLIPEIHNGTNSYADMHWNHAVSNEVYEFTPLYFISVAMHLLVTYIVSFVILRKIYLKNKTKEEKLG